MRHRDFSRLTAEFLQLCANLTRLVDFADQKKIWLFRSRARRCINSAHSDWLLVSLSWLVYSLCLLRSWCWSMALGQPICLEAKNSAKRQEEFIYIWTETCIIGFLYICRKHITISPYDHTHAQPRTHVHTHIYIHRHAQHEHSTYTSSQHHIPKHHLTHHNFTSHATRSVYLRLHTFILLPPNLTSHEYNITSHTHIHIRITSACTSHILQTASFIRYTYREHNQSDTPVHVHTYIHTHKLTHHHPSITLILPLPLLPFYAQSKSGEVVNIWGYPVL